MWAEALTMFKRYVATVANSQHVHALPEPATSPSNAYEGTKQVGEEVAGRHLLRAADAALQPSFLAPLPSFPRICSSASSNLSLARRALALSALRLSSLRESLSQCNMGQIFQIDNYNMVGRRNKKGGGLGLLLDCVELQHHALGRIQFDLQDRR